MSCDACGGWADRVDAAAVYRTLRVSDDNHSEVVSLRSGVPGWAAPRGWELQLVADPAASARLELRIDLWTQVQGSVGLRVNGPRIDRGGRIFLPYPTADVSLVDAANAGALSTLALWATPYHGHGAVQGTTRLYGSSRVNAVKADDTDVSLPDGATEYRVIFEVAATLPIRVTERDQVGVLGTYLVDPAQASVPGLDPSGGWRLCPPDGNGTGKIVIGNTDPVNDRVICVYWRYDLISAR